MSISVIEQLKDVVITVSFIEYDDDGSPYANTQVYRFDLEGAVETFIESVSKLPFVVHAEQLVAK